MTKRLIFVLTLFLAVAIGVSAPSTHERPMTARTDRPPRRQKHAVLRDAGLVTTHRDGRHVIAQRSRLGDDICQS